jgi:hypothetical protein
MTPHQKRGMDILGALWHLLNFFAPALGVGLIAAGAAKLLWRRDLAAVRFVALAGWAFGAGALVSVGGLVLFGHDGRMATYAAMVLGCAATLWWAGFARRR